MKNIKRQRLYYGDEPPITPPPTAGGTPEKVFKQADVDGIVQKRMAEAEKKFTTQRQSDLQRMQSLETDSAAKADLEKQLEELNNRYKTKEELAADAFKKEKASWEKRQQESENASKTWRSKYEDNLRERELLDAASSKDADAQSAEQIAMLLRPNSRVVERIVEGKSTGEFETRINFHTTKDGKALVLDLTPAEAIKQMKGDVKRWGNLFNSGKAGGTGNSPQHSGNDTVLGITQDEFTRRFLKGEALPNKAR